MGNKELAAAIVAGAVETPEQRAALRKAVSETRSDIIATDGNHKGEGKGRYEVRYGNGRAIKQRPGEVETVLFANARRLTLDLLDKLDASYGTIDTMREQAKEQTASVEKLTAALAAMTAERDKLTDEVGAAKSETETIKAELAKVAGELAVLKVAPAEAPAEVATATA